MQFVVAIGWTLSVLFAFISIFGLGFFYDRDSFYVALPNFSPVIRIGYGAFHRSIFALALAWVIFACTRQYGGLIWFSYWRYQHQLIY